MIGDALVIDAVVHGYNSPPETYTHPLSGVVVQSLYRGYHQVFSPRGDRRWLLDEHRFARVDADILGGAVFDESQTDFCVYHDIPLYGLYKGGRRRCGWAANCASAIPIAWRSSAASGPTSPTRSARWTG